MQERQWAGRTPRKHWKRVGEGALVQDGIVETLWRGTARRESVFFGRKRPIFRQSFERIEPLDNLGRSLLPQPCREKVNRLPSKNATFILWTVDTTQQELCLLSPSLRRLQNLEDYPMTAACDPNR